jgi:hypothetical protein
MCVKQYLLKDSRKKQICETKNKKYLRSSERKLDMFTIAETKL